MTSSFMVKTLGMFRWFKNNKDVGLLLFRLFIGRRLLYGVIDNIMNWEQMLEFEQFLRAHKFPFPLFAAILSVYSQAIAGLCIIIGFKIRWVSFLMIFNFIIALIMVHWGQTIEQTTPALSMLFGSVLFLFLGAGKYGLDKEPIVLTNK